MEAGRGDRLTTLAVLDERLARLGNGLDLAAVQDWLGEKLAGVTVRSAPDPGHRMAELGDVLAESGAERLVLGLSSPQYALGEVQAQARLAGLDPLGIETVDLGTHGALVHSQTEATEKTKLLLAAAVARARAFPGSQPAMVKPHLPKAASRRFWFGLSHLEHRPVPWIDKERCVAESGCRLCVEVCPVDALAAGKGTIGLDTAACESCGLCLPACPKEAVVFAGQAPVQDEAQLALLLNDDLTTLAPRGLLFYCAQTAATLAALAQDGWTYPAGWLPIQVPCVGMLTPMRLLGCLTAGAAAVAVVSCHEQCAFGQPEQLAGRVSYCRELLERCGETNPPVLLCPATDPELTEQLNTLPTHTRQRAYSNGSLHGQSVEQGVDMAADGEVPASPPAADRQRGAAAVVHELAQASPRPDEVALTHPQSPFGLIEVTEGCTVCGMCAEVCPTQALLLEQQNGTLSLTFDPELCTACGQCLPTCPEAEQDVLHLQHATDVGRLSAGRTTLYQDETQRCESCGAPIAPTAMLERVTALLGDAHPGTTAVIARYCPSCRGIAPMPTQTG